MTSIQLEDGRILEFPDSMPHDEIKSVLQKKFPSPQNEREEKIKTLKEAVQRSSPLHVFKAGLMGLGQAGENIASTLTGGYAPRAIKDVFKPSKNPSIAERAAEGLGQYAPLIAAGPMGLIPDIATGALYSATQQSGEPSLKGAGVGAGIGGASSGTFNLLNKLMMTSNPIVKAAARSLVGGAAGYGLGGVPGAEGGAALGFGLPFIAKKLGFTGKQPGTEIAQMTNPQETAGRYEAGMKLGTPLTPGEASARPDITAAEAGIGRVGEAASERVKIGQERINQQKQAIDNLFKTITPSNGIASFDVRKAAQDSISQMEKARQDAVQPLYEVAYDKKVAPNLITKLENSDATIRNAIKEAMNDPKYQVEGELLNVPKNSIKVLDYAKRNIDAKIEQAKNFGDKDAVRVLTTSKNRLLDSISNFSPKYKEARSTYEKLSKPIDEIVNGHVGQISRLQDTDLKNVSTSIFDPSQTNIDVLRQIKDKVQNQNPEAWDSIVKNEMNRLMTQGKNRGITGRAFFDNVLANQNKFNQFKVALEHNPEALSQLNNMKTAWEHLINMETPRTAAGQSKTSMNKARESVQAIINMYNEMVGGKKEIEALNYLYSPKWQEDLIKIKNMPKKEQSPMMVMLLGKTIAPSYLLSGKEGNK